MALPHSVHSAYYYCCFRPGVIHTAVVTTVTPLIDPGGLVAPLPVLPDVYRMTLDWGPYNGVTPVNVIHWLDGSGASNEAELAAAFDASIDNSLWKPISSHFLLAQVSIIKLDGVSATQVYPLTSGAAGGSTGGMIPQAAQILSLRTPLRGPAGRGRLFLGPIGEDWETEGQADSSLATDLQTGWSDFLETIGATDGEWALVVASYTHETVSAVTSLTVPLVLATQRRRQDQMRR
uniref:Uncharacterized protein n=1 Tax=uncultured prokaryote TaxID=198431 RepID=A0A0H5Q618_9ZZZZ|nr:hypothetical protein [uncultured prokaryote]